MSVSLAVTLVSLGLGGGFLSGLLGLGGAIFMIPLLLYVPPLVGAGLFDMKQVAAISMVQVLSASLAGVIVHRQNRFVSRPILLTMGLGNAAGNLAGSLYSLHAKSGSLIAIFATLAVIASASMCIPKRDRGGDIGPDAVMFNRPLAVTLSVLIGIVGGMVGAPGAFAYIPVMIYLLNIPTRIAIGSNLGIVFCGAVAGTIGKMATHQILWPAAIVLIMGTIPGARIGARVSRQVRIQYLRYAIAIVIAIAGIKMWSQVLGW